jgi:PAS domain S-box-containing protein
LNHTQSSISSAKLANSILENVGALILVADSTGSIIYCSPSILKLLKVTEDEVLGAGWWSITRLDKSARAREVETIKALISGKMAVNTRPYVKQILDRSGNEYWIQWQDSLGPDGTFIGVGQNITEQYLAQQVIDRQSEQLKRLSLVAEKTENIILILDKDGNVEWISDSFQRLNNTTLEQLVAQRGKNIRQISNNPNIGQILDRVISEKVSVNYESRNIHIDRELWEFSTISPVLDSKGNVTNIIIIDSDVTDKKILERELERLSIVASRTDNAVVIANPDGIIEWANDGLMKMHSKNISNPRSIIGKSLSELSSNPDLERIIQNSRKQKSSFIYEAESTNEDGQKFWVQSTLTPIVDDGGNVTHLVIIDADITARKLAESVITEKNKDITDSINYAVRIQHALLPGKKKFLSLLPDSFLFFRPRDIVSGDFYFVESIRMNDGTILTGFAVGDCTGHGVPGAFMSMIATSFLKQSLSESSVNSPADALDFLSRKLSFMLHQHSEYGEIRDGLDIAFCVLNNSTLELYYSGAHRPLVVIQNNELTEIRGTNRAVGYSATNEAFANHKVQLSKGDCVYLFSDGYADQFGGPHGKKFKHQRFKDLLLANWTLSIQEQRKKLETTFDEWKGNLEQLDDICVIGVRI